MFWRVRVSNQPFRSLTSLRSQGSDVQQEGGRKLGYTDLKAVLSETLFEPQKL